MQFIHIIQPAQRPEKGNLLHPPLHMTPLIWWHNQGHEDSQENKMEFLVTGVCSNSTVDQVPSCVCFALHHPRALLHASIFLFQLPSRQTDGLASDT